MGNSDIHGGKFEQLEAASKATAEFDSYFEDEHPSKKPQKRKRWPAATIIIVLLLVAVGGGGYWWYKNYHQKSKPTTNAVVATPPSIITSETKQYSSTNFNLSFNYPQNWIVTDTTNGNLMTVTSPALTLKDATGASFTGQVVLSFKNKQQPLPEFDKGNALAVLVSQKITYTKPSSVQRGSTYLSFLNYASSPNSTQLDGVYITGDVGYQVGQAIPAADLVPIDPVTMVTFLKCANSACSGTGTQTGISPNMWSEPQFATPLTDMLESLTINS